MEQAVWLIIPFFEEGGRYTINDVHYVKEGRQLVPAGETAFAKDVVFGYRSSDLRQWVEEKTQGRIPAASVQSLSLDEIRQGGPDCIADKLAGCKPASVCIVNAADCRDLEVVTLGLLQAQRQGRRFLFRTAASFVRVRAGLRARPLLTCDEMSAGGVSGGLIIVGSHVPRSSEQLNDLLQHEDVKSLELSVEKILSPQARGEEIEHSVACAEGALSMGQNVVIYTSRKLLTGSGGESSLSIGRRVSQALVEVVRSLKARPGYILAKGGVTSSDIATAALNMTRAQVLGQILPGVPVWRAGPESKWPDLPYVVFPGNVGSTEAISDAVRKFKIQEGDGAHSSFESRRSKR